MPSPPPLSQLLPLTLPVYTFAKPYAYIILFSGINPSGSLPVSGAGSVSVGDVAYLLIYSTWGQMPTSLLLVHMCACREREKEREEDFFFHYMGM